MVDKPTKATGAEAAEPAPDAKAPEPPAPPDAEPVSTAAAAGKKLNDFRVNALMNARYHSVREGFLDKVHRTLIFGVIVTGAAPFAALLAELGLAPWIIAVCALSATVLGALDLAFDLSNRARAHSMMKRRYFELLADVDEGKKELPEAEACLHRYSADEEQAYQALLTLSWNAAQEMVYGDTARERYRVPWIHRLLRNFWRQDGCTFSVIAREPSPDAPPIDG